MNRVDQLAVREGDDVVAGRLLAEFADARMKDAAVQQAEATVAEAQAELARVKAGGRPTDINAQKNQIASLTAQEDIARRDAKRARLLVPTGAGARAVAERAKAAADRAAALRREAESKLASLAQSRPEDIAFAETQLRSAEASRMRARADAALSDE
jgi:HlyD family secretion protein